MRIQLANGLADFSEQNSEKLRLMSFFTVIISAFIVIGGPLMKSGASIYPEYTPVYMLAFISIFLLPVMSEYMAVWLREEASVHVCRCVFSGLAMAMAIYEVFLFFSYGSAKLEGLHMPVSISSLLARLLS